MFTSFNLAQTFYVDPAVVQNAPSCHISAIDLYFSAKPDRTNNASGINSPGVSIFIAPTQFSVPVISPDAYEVARLEYDQVATSSDATVPSKARFMNPVVVNTDTEYALVIVFDGSENFQLWTSVVGDFLIDTKKISAGPSGKYIGNYYSYNNQIVRSPQFPIGANSMLLNSAMVDYSSFWTALAGTDLKFAVYASRYFFNGEPIGSNATINATTQIIRSQILQSSDGDSISYLYPSTNMEFVMFDQASSFKETFVGGQWAFQNTFNYPGGWANGANLVTVSTNGGTRITANNNLPNGQAFNWNTVFNNYAGPKYLVINSGNTHNVRLVNTIVSNTILDVTEPVSFVNAAAHFKITPVGQVDSFNKASPFGSFESIMMLTNSSANSTVRFVNTTIESVNVVTGGTGYSNSDVLYVTGFEFVTNKVLGGYVAVGNVTTNSTGGIATVSWSNVGAGFTNTAAMHTVLCSAANTNPTSNTSSGSGANLVYSVGATIKTEQRPNIFRNCRVVDFDLADVIPFFDFDMPGGTKVDLKFQSNYYRVADGAVLNGLVSYVDENAVQDEVDLKLFQMNPLINSRVPVFPSRSNEWVIKYNNGAVNNVVSSGITSNAIVMIADWTSNNDFLCVSVDSVPSVSLYKYIINDDYTLEETDHGHAWARQITTKIPFGRLAEDLVVYLTAYMPSVNDLEVYARIYNSADSDAFEDKDWTRLTKNFAPNLVSSLTDQSQFVELAYGMQAFPNTDMQMTGSVTTQLANAVVAGANTLFSTEIVAGDLIKISNPLFANAYVIDVVNAVTNNTSLTINNPIANTDYAGTGFRIDKIHTFKHQAFFNLTNSNNAIRYYNSSMSPVDLYDSVQIKVIMLSSQSNIIPRIDDIRAIGVSA